VIVGPVVRRGHAKEATRVDRRTSKHSIASGATTRRPAPAPGCPSSSATKASVREPDPCPLSDSSAPDLGCLNHRAPLVLGPPVSLGMCVKSERLPIQIKEFK
jgi:hypothetical protein